MVRVYERLALFIKDSEKLVTLIRYFERLMPLRL